MATAVSFSVVYYLLFVAIATGAHGKVIKAAQGQRGVELGPRNTAVYQGDSVQLQCVTDSLESTNIQWFEYVTTGAKNLISSGYELVDSHPNRDRYSLYHPNRQTFNLNVADVNMVDGGYYECEDSNNPTSVLGAELIVLESSPTCKATYPSDGALFEGDVHTIQCTQSFSSTPGIHPLQTWTGPQPIRSNSAVSDNTVSSNITFLVGRSMDTQYWTCTTNFTDDQFLGLNRDNSAPTYSFLWSSNSISVYWRPQNMTVWPNQPSYEIGQTITCYADAWPLPKYLWESLRNGQMWLGSSITLTPDMIGYQLMRCYAANYINGVLYDRNYYWDVYVDPPTTPATN